MILDELAELTRVRIEKQKKEYSPIDLQRDVELLAAREMEVQEFDYPFEEALSGKLFGTGKDHEGLDGMIGDYVALAVSDRSVFNTHIEAQETPGGHAGLTREEIAIPLIVIEKKP